MSLILVVLALLCFLALSFGLVHARTAKATDTFAFGMLAWEVSLTFLCFPVWRCSFAAESATIDHRSLLILK